jgi:hypothetical protein
MALVFHNEESAKARYRPTELGTDTTILMTSQIMSFLSGNSSDDGGPGGI